MADHAFGVNDEVEMFWRDVHSQPFEYPKESGHLTTSWIPSLGMKILLLSDQVGRLRKK